MHILQVLTFQLIWKRVKKSGHQVAYDQDDSFNALVRRISALPFTKPEDMFQAFCEFEGSRLLIVEDEKEHNFIRQKVRGTLPPYMQTLYSNS